MTSDGIPAARRCGGCGRRRSRGRARGRPAPPGLTSSRSWRRRAGSPRTRPGATAGWCARSLLPAGLAQGDAVPARRPDAARALRRARRGLPRARGSSWWRSTPGRFRPSTRSSDGHAGTASRTWCGLDARPGARSSLQHHAEGVAALHSPRTAVVDYVAGLRRARRPRSRQPAAGRSKVSAPVDGAGGGRRRRAPSPRAGRTLPLRPGDRLRRPVERLAGADGGRARTTCASSRSAGSTSPSRPDKAALVRGLVYPVPDPRYPFLGVHLTRGVDDVGARRPQRRARRWRAEGLPPPRRRRRRPARPRGAAGAVAPRRRALAQRAWPGDGRARRRRAGAGRVRRYLPQVEPRRR